MRSLTFCLGLLALSSALVVPALGQTPPAPGVAPAPPPPPPPPRGPGAILARGPGGAIHVDVRCTDAETTRACVDIATQLYDKLNNAVQAK